MHPVTGAGSEGSLGERYNRNLDFEKEIEADYEKSHPGTALAANLIGGTALTGGVGMTRSAQRRSVLLVLCRNRSAWGRAAD